MLKLTRGEEKKWSRYLADALYAYWITAGPAGLSPYHAAFGQKARLLHATEGHRDEGDRLRLVHEAQQYLEEFRENKRNEYKGKEPKGSKRLPVGAYVSLRVINPKKGQTQWQPGYRVLSNHDGGMRVEDLETRRVVRVNQRNVRLLPEALDYDEVDSLPERREIMRMLPPSKAEPITVGPNPFLPTSRGEVATIRKEKLSCEPIEQEWNSWLQFVRPFANKGLSSIPGLSSM